MEKYIPDPFIKTMYWQLYSFNLRKSLNLHWLFFSNDNYNLFSKCKSHSTFNMKHQYFGQSLFQLHALSSRHHNLLYQPFKQLYGFFKWRWQCPIVSMKKVPAYCFKFHVAPVYWRWCGEFLLDCSDFFPWHCKFEVLCGCTKNHLETVLMMQLNYN